MTEGIDDERAGRAGAGKTVLAQRLGEALGVPVVHLDRLHWGPNWEPVAAALFEARHTAAVSGGAWVIRFSEWD